MTPKDSADGLTAKEQLFADAMLAGANKTNAAIAAGYAPSGAAAVGSRLAKNDKICKYLVERKKVAATTAELSHEYVLRRLMQIENGKDTSTAVRALELIGKHLGMFPERSVVVDPAARSTDDITRRLAVVDKKLGYAG